METSHFRLCIVLRSLCHIICEMCMLKIAVKFLGASGLNNVIGS